ncbi:three-helix bundle dimerization domain-containing protein [uncultured Jatrophihabitans sp.]|uniref:three-helix bundle dimerization domain-containing protein n=1 Tax=uncultured Jatrophihabitans sp. TaxID=1610747 RepID=UPI0035CC03BC
MTTTTEAQQARRVKAEQAALDALAERLAIQFPELSAEEIAARIQGRYEGFDSSAVRDFVPVLVE